MDDPLGTDCGESILLALCESQRPKVIPNAQSLRTLGRDG